MKKSILYMLFISMSTIASAQHGLENIIVEKYYISDANDETTNDDGGILPPGSVTYRIYADMLPGYKFQAAYGVENHELRLATSTLFFNNEDRGAINPTYTVAQASHNTVMLDSWLTAGAASADINGIPNNFGVLKTEDDGVNTIVNSDGVLQSTNELAGIPLTIQDGLFAGAPEDFTKVGIDNEIQVFNNATTGNLFSTINGSWAALNGATGPTLSNRVLIAQVTTNGIFSFELNIQIGAPNGGVQNYVARNPVDNEIQIPSLIYSNNPLASPSMTLNMKMYIQGFYNLSTGFMDGDPLNYPGSGCLNILYQNGFSNNTDPEDVDSIDVSLRGEFDFLQVETQRVVVKRNGTLSATFTGPATSGGYYWIQLKSRNLEETWSHNPIYFSPTTSYDFTTASTQAFDEGPLPMFEVVPGVWACYNGDIDQDGAVTSLDMTSEENDANVNAFGYYASDLDGDAGSTSLDMTLIENNGNVGVFLADPNP